MEELGVVTKIDKFLGGLITHFNRPDGTEVEKTTIYFLAYPIGSESRTPQSDETDDEAVWVSVDKAMALLEGQNNEEASIVKRATD